MKPTASGEHPTDRIRSGLRSSPVADFFFPHHVPTSDHSKRKIREMLADHFDVDLEHRKKTINQMVDEQNALVSAKVNSAAAGSSTSAASSSKKTGKSETSPKAKAAKSGSKRKKASSDVEDDEEGDEDESYNDNAVAAAASTSASSEIDSDSDTTEAEQFSELEEDTSHQSRKKPKKSSSKSTTTTKKSSPTRQPSSSSTKFTSASGGSEAEQRLTRLKKLVTECGVRKQWKKLYLEAGVGEKDFKAQCNVVQSVLKDLGMTGKGSVEQARKIREERDFADELAALQENEVLGRSTRGARKATGRASMKEADDDDKASDFEEASTKKARRTKVVADDKDSEDEGPRKKTFKSSLASFAADLNSDSD
ncbi:hypothetical protein PHSY_004090 [Pseudozyma hubeiensis SY62]|uniref:DEK-C domain-containing protein n=1 Tax=Pseudozyma hubeiensis (strain SY62) TaxID=1305764 RepID=R9PEI5_PSEHS|nr:hypothetical protein PHSY_004090 [Pseudozyma hubeiensis SY62]GAC96510.1 hypothetical protein PHSY_004090 [Pseudozyma hubeiensis SY62]